MPADSVRSPATIARSVMRGADRAVLSSLLPPDAAPYASLVLTALDRDATPLLLISALAVHTRNILADPRVALLFDGTAGFAQPLEGPRVTVIGWAEPTALPHHRARYLARHPDAALYARFGDFAWYRVVVERAHLVAGFGAIHWITAAELLVGSEEGMLLPAAEAELVATVNRDHAGAVDACVRGVLGREETGWQATGVDPDGIDLRNGSAVARLDFLHPAHDPGAVYDELLALSEAGRRSLAARNSR